MFRNRVKCWEWGCSVRGGGPDLALQSSERELVQDEEGKSPTMAKWTPLSSLKYPPEDNSEYRFRIRRV